jgi:hypothetical protein
MTTLNVPAQRWHALLLATAAVGIGLSLYAAVAQAGRVALAPSPGSWILIGVVLAVGGGAGAYGMRRRAETGAAMEGRLAIAALLAATSFLAISSLVYVFGFLRIPVDLVSFSESPFVDDIIKLRLGVPIYGPVTDNNTYPYTPGTQILTYGIARLLGHPTSIPAYRTIQFGYVILAALVAAGTCHQLARGFLRADEYQHRPLWIAVWIAVLLLLVNEPSFNPYTHSLHNDGLALLISMCGFFLIARHHAAPSAWLVAPMAVLPALGFLVKQNQLLWAGVFAIYLLMSGKAPWKLIGIYLALCVVAVLSVLGGSILLWGDAFRYWIFSALGDKQVSVLRSMQHLLRAGLFVAAGLWAARVLVLPELDRGRFAVWGSWAFVLSIQAYTSGIGFVMNHMGPGIVLAGCWFLVALVRVWPRRAASAPFWRYPVEQAGAAALVVLLLAGMGLMREPGPSVPDDLDRYIAEVEREFSDLPAEQVLMDVGSWLYLREGVLMKDRSAPVSLHVGANQPEINRAALAETIERIESKQYRRILARELDSPRTAYDYQDRGSGVKDAMLEHYRIVRRIAGVDVSRWWPRHMIAEIVVLEPR